MTTFVVFLKKARLKYNLRRSTKSLNAKKELRYFKELSLWSFKLQMHVGSWVQFWYSEVSKILKTFFGIEVFLNFLNQLLNDWKYLGSFWLLSVSEVLTGDSPDSFGFAKRLEYSTVIKDWTSEWYCC